MRQEKEDHLETMYLLKRRQNQVTRSDIEKHLNASPARVNHMVEELIEEGYLYKDEKRRIEHIIDEKIYLGIRMFMESRHDADTDEHNLFCGRNRYFSLAKNVMEFAQAYQQQDSSTMNSALKGIVAGVMMAAVVAAVAGALVYKATH